MASPSTVITMGFGSFGSVNLIPTLGYGVRITGTFGCLMACDMLAPGLARYDVRTPGLAALDTLTPGLAKMDVLR